MPPAEPQSPTSDEEYLSDYIQNHHIPLPQLDAEDCALQQNPDEQFRSLPVESKTLNGHNTANDTANSDPAAAADDENAWQNNWLFRKRSGDSDDESVGLLSTTSSVTNSTTVGMLVPSPTEDVKTLIGDRTTDEVSDLSEAGSDTESDDLRDATRQQQQGTNYVDIPHIIVQSKTLINGKNDVESFDLSQSMNESANDPPNSDVEHSLQTLDDVVSNAEATLAPVVVDLVPKLIVDADLPVPAPRFVQIR